MAETAIFGPFLAMMLLTLVVWVYMFARRIRFLTENEVASEQLTEPGALDRMSPPEVLGPSDNLKNLFETPVLFYALTLYLFAAGQVDALYVGAAWVFFAFRALHSAVHCTFNHVMLRFWLYFVASLALWCMLLRSVVNHFFG